MRQIAIYGKGGIGKSSITSNLSAALASQKLNILQIGCDPKHDSTRNLLNGKNIQCLLNAIKKKGEDVFDLDDIMYAGFNGVKCIEAGGPEPGVGCAGRGVILTIETLRKLGVYDLDFDYIFYDVLGDVVCGGFAVPIREGYAEEVYLVVSGEFLSIYAANNICKAIERFGNRSNTRLGGLIANMKGVDNESCIINKFAEKINSKIISVIPRDNLIQNAEISKQTVIQKYPHSKISKKFFHLAKEIQNLETTTIPKPLSEHELNELIGNLKF